MIDKEKYVFLLGGHDLEMLEIKKILEEQGLKYLDNNLEWGAKLSSYKEYFNEGKTFVGIELTKDIATPKNYIEIDHHNENSNKPSSIEQIAELLKIELNHYQKLVAANDKGYIPAMEKMGATKKEIDKIRLKDRNAQGVTKEDEKLALLSIQKKLFEINGVISVNALTNKFSAITDRMYPCKRLLIYSENEITYYGERASVCAKKLKEQFEKVKLYSGGGPDGYFGIAQNKMSATSFEKLKLIIAGIIALEFAEK